MASSQFSTITHKFDSGILIYITTFYCQKPKIKLKIHEPRNMHSRFSIFPTNIPLPWVLPWSTMLILLIIMCLTIWTLGFKVYAQASSGRIRPKPHFVRMLSSVVHLLFKSKLVVIFICCEYDKFPRYSHSQGREKKKNSTKSLKKISTRICMICPYKFSFINM